MTNISPYNTYPTTVYQPALGGFFSWLRKAVNTVATVLQSTGVVPFMGVLIDFTNGDGMFFGYNSGSIIDLCKLPGEGPCGNRNATMEIEDTTDYPLTAAEEAVLDEWVSRFTPILSMHLSKIKGFIINPPTTAEFNAAYNEIQEFTSVLNYYKQYVLSAGEQGYSVNMLKSRNQFITVQAAMLNEQLFEYIASTGMIVNTRQEKVSVSASKYAALRLNTPNVFSVTTTKIESVQTLDGGDTVISDAPIEDTPGLTTTGNTQTRWFMWLALAGVAYWLTKPKKSKN